MNRRELLQDLAQRIQEIELSHHPHRQPVRIPLSVSPLSPASGERGGGEGVEPARVRPPHPYPLSPEAGERGTKHSQCLELPAGSLVELISTTEGDGSCTLALWMARHACAGRVLVIADGEGLFYPPGVPWLDWDRCIIVRPRALRDAYLAIEQSLRSPAVGAVVARCGKMTVPIVRRLQFAAEAGGSIGFLLRSSAVLDTPAFAALRLLVRCVEPEAQARDTSSTSRKRERRKSVGESVAYASGSLHQRQLQLDILRARDGSAGRSFVLELDHETGDVHLFPGLAPATTHSRSAGTSG